jgi:hypothetical protein
MCQDGAATVQLWSSWVGKVSGWCSYNYGIDGWKRYQVGAAKVMEQLGGKCVRVQGGVATVMEHVLYCTIVGCEEQYSTCMSVHARLIFENDFLKILKYEG